MKKLSQIIHGKDCLYRYRSGDENSIKALMEDKLFFSIPKFFNDPYDNLIFADSNRIISEIIGNINYGMDDYIEKCKRQRMPGISIAEAMWKNKQSKEMMLNTRVELIYSALDAIKSNLKNNTRVICFSEINDSMLMWSHYANYHKGFVLVYEKNDISNAKRFNENNYEITRKTKLVPVNYVDKQSDMTKACLEYIRHNMFESMGDVEEIDASIPADVIRVVISEKAKEWSYEREWRLIPRIPSIEIESDLSYIKCRPMAVIVGSQCQGEERNRLIEICQKKNIPVYGIYLSESSPEFKLCINDNGNMEIASPEYLFVYKK